MHKTRIIPVLLIKNNKLVKSTKFEDPKYIGDPINAVRIFNQKKIDEILVIDIDATKNKKYPNIDLIKKIADECYMPFSYGGGINSVDSARDVIYNGSEKIIINNCFLKNEKIIKDLSNNFGKQSVVVAVDVIKKDNTHKVFNYINKKIINIELKDYIKKIELLGAGEVFLNFVDRDGTMEGFDIEIIKNIVDVVSIPMLVCGGAGNLMDFKNLLKNVPKISGMCAGSFFIYQGKMKSVLISAPNENERKQIYDL